MFHFLPGTHIFQAGTEYMKLPAFCIKLDKVPRLSTEIKAKLRRFIAANKMVGVHNVPRRFNPTELAEHGQVKQYMVYVT